MANHDKTEMLQRFGAQVRRYREQLNLSQEELGFRADDTHRTYISDVENGKRNLSLTKIDALASGLEVTLSELLEGL